MTDYNRAGHKDMLGLTDILHDSKVDAETYAARIQKVMVACESCKRNNIPAGNRLEKMLVIYQEIKDRDAIGDTDCSVTDADEIFALILDHIPGIDKTTLLQHAPLLEAKYHRFKSSNLTIDTKPLYEYVEPEIEKYLKIYSIPTKENQ
jgi:hypothetical protein